MPVLPILVPEPGDEAPEPAPLQQFFDGRNHKRPVLQMKELKKGHIFEIRRSVAHLTAPG